MSDRIREFTEFRQRMNQRILEHDNQVVRRFFALDTQTYKDGALPLKTKELLGLVASMVLRCDDCISYHIAQCKEAGVSRDELFETFSVALVAPAERPSCPATSLLESGRADSTRRPKTRPCTRLKPKVLKKSSKVGSSASRVSSSSAGRAGLVDIAARCGSWTGVLILDFTNS